MGFTPLAVLAEWETKGQKPEGAELRPQVRSPDSWAWHLKNKNQPIQSGQEGTLERHG